MAGRRHNSEVNDLMQIELVANRPPKRCKDGGMSDGWSENYRLIQDHPCFDPKAAHYFGRMHLPVAPKCNIQCNYCVREFDCVNESRPGVTSQILEPGAAIFRVREVLELHPYITVLGIAGPGDPLANEETFETLLLTKREFPDLILCLSTNGLLLPDKLDDLIKLNVWNLTVTVNTVHANIGAQIYSYVRCDDQILRGVEGAELLLNKQMAGIERAVKAGMVVKLNTVFIPTVNEEDVVNVSQMGEELGVYMHNIMPLIPQYKFSRITPPSRKELGELRKRCKPHLRQMVHCRQCRADAIGKLGEDNACFKARTNNRIRISDSSNKQPRPSSEREAR